MISGFIYEKESERYLYVGAGKIFCSLLSTARIILQKLGIELYFNFNNIYSIFLLDSVFHVEVNLLLQAISKVQESSLVQVCLKHHNKFQQFIDDLKIILSLI